MATGKRREFLKFIRRHRKKNWKQAAADLEYLEARAKIFEAKEEKRLKAVARKRAASKSGS